MRDIDRDFLRKLASWSADGVPVSSLYLDVDGRRHPRRQDYIGRAEQLCHDLRRQSQAQHMQREAYHSVVRDTVRMLDFVRDLNRGPIRGVALFSSSRAGFWEDVVVPRPVPEFERGLHDYLKRRIVARTTLPMTASVDLVLEKSLAVEEAVEAERERRVVEQVRAE